MKKKLILSMALMLLLISYVPNAIAIDRSQVLYPYNFDVTLPLNDNPGQALVPILLCVNGENGFAICGRTFLSYRNVIFAEVGWTIAPDNQIVNTVVPDYVLQAGSWTCMIDENAQPGGCMVYKFYY